MLSLEFGYVGKDHFWILEYFLFQGGYSAHLYFFLFAPNNWNPIGAVPEKSYITV